MPTYEVPESVYAEYRKLSPEARRAFRKALVQLIEALRHKPPRFPPRLRVKGVQGHPGVWELSFTADGRATFRYREEIEPGEPHVIWRRIGDHSVGSRLSWRSPRPSLRCPHAGGARAGARVAPRRGGAAPRARRRDRNPGHRPSRLSA